MKSSDWRGAAGLSELTENGMIGRQMVCCRKIWEAPPPLQTSQMKTASPRPILFLFCVNFFVWTARCPPCPHRASVDVYSGQISQVMTSSGSRSLAQSKHTCFMSDLTSSALEFVSGTLHPWTKKMCPTSCLCRERHGNHARCPDESKQEEQQQKRKWGFRVPIETWQRLFDLFIRALRSAITCAQVHASSLIR